MFDQVFFDFDSTLVTVEGIDEIAAVLEKPEVLRLTRGAMDGKLSVEEAYSRRLELLKLKEVHLRMLAKIYQACLCPGAVELVNLLKSLGKEVGIISGGFQEAIKPVAAFLGIEIIEAVELDFTEDWAALVPSALLTQGGKARVLRRLKKGRCAFVGDGITDLETEEVAERFIPYSGVVRRSFIETCSHQGYAGENLLGLLGFLLSNEEMKECARIHPQETRLACDYFLEKENITGKGNVEKDELIPYATARYFIPGPTQPNFHSPAPYYSMIGHRSEEFGALFQKIQSQLHEFLGWDGKFLIGSCSGTGMLEAVLSSLSRGKVLSLQSGDFSKRWASIASALGHEVEVLLANPRMGVTPTQLKSSSLLSGKDVVLITHSETSNGTLNPVEDLARSIKESHPCLVLVDGVSSIGGIDLDVGDIDGVVFSSQKCFATSPGLGFLWISPKLEEEIQNSDSTSFYFDLKLYIDYLAKGNVPFTPAIQQMQALSLELEEFQKDRAKHFENYQRMACRVWDFCREAGLNIYAQEGYRSLSVSCIQNPGEVDVVRELRRRGLILARGYGDLKSTHFRIGHMGRVEISDLEVLLSALKEYLDV